MKIILTIIAFISLLCLPVVFAEDVSVDQLKQMMTRSADNLTTIPTPALQKALSSTAMNRCKTNSRQSRPRKEK